MYKKRRRSEEMDEGLDISDLKLVESKTGVYFDLNYLLEKLESESGSRGEVIRGLGNIISSMRSIFILYDVDTFYLSSDVKKYIDVFRDLFKDKRLLKYIFVIDRVLPINSANGKIFIVKSLSKKTISPKLLIKVALSKEVDPISYEYYVGLTLNRLRVDYNVEHFAVMYGRFFCGLDPKVDALTSKQDLESIELCDMKYSDKTHLVYEFIRDIETDNVVTLNDYILKLRDEDNTLLSEISIINIMILVLYALQQAQDRLDFTHYDLHAKNILVVKLLEEREYNIEYNGNKLRIVTDVVPHIIDYGRSHINPMEAISENGVFKDYERNMELGDFEMYQKLLFKKYILTRERVSDLKTIKKIELHLHKLAFRYIYKTEFSGEIEETFETLEFKKGILEMYYNGEYIVENGVFMITRCDFGIDTTVSHKKYDFFRICRIVGGIISNLSKEFNLYSKIIWRNLGDKLELQYPYHDGWYYSLVSDYKPNPIGIMTDDDAFDTPIDVVYYLYNIIYKDSQYGGGEDEKNEKEKFNNKSKEMNNNSNNDTMNKKNNNMNNSKNENSKNENSKNENNGKNKKNDDTKNKDTIKIDLERIKRNLVEERVKYDFMKIDYSDMNTGSFNINENVNK